MKNSFDETDKLKGLASPFVGVYYSFYGGREFESPAGQIFGATDNMRFLGVWTHLQIFTHSNISTPHSTTYLFLVKDSFRWLSQFKKWTLYDNFLTL